MQSYMNERGVTVRHGLTYFFRRREMQDSLRSVPVPRTPQHRSTGTSSSREATNSELAAELVVLSF